MVPVRLLEVVIMIELEKKILLSEKEYFALISMINNKTTMSIHKNFYFDSDDFKMNSQNITCRIRQKENKYLATIKKHDINDRSIEESKEVQNEFDDSLFDGMNIKIQGILTTERLHMYSDDCCEIVIDKNVFLNTTDYELEIEYAPGNEARVKFLLRNIAKAIQYKVAGINVEELCDRWKNTKSKSSRFFERKKLLNKMKGS